ncbi:MAG TPA: DUF1918 domain-containing protein [Actinoplanes sp.]|nr:DUF1918 domain-containing protein [Actinoplanes sp.]
MIAQVGDRLVLDGTYLGDSRVGVVVAADHPEGAPPYRVRWLDDGRTTLIFPGPEARVEPRTGDARSAVTAEPRC